MKVLIAGGGGYIGSHVAWYLFKGGHVPVILDNWINGKPRHVEGLDLITADACDRQKTTAVFEHFTIDAVLFALWPRAGTRAAESVAQRLFPVSVGGAVVQGELCSRFGVRHVVVLADASVYGRTPEEGVSEQSPEKGGSVRAEAALCMERVFRAYASEGCFSLTILRLFNVAGASPDRRVGEEREEGHNLIPAALMAAQNGTPFILRGNGLPTADGTAVRDFVHVQDVCEAVRLVLEQHSLPAFQLYNVCSGSGKSVKEVLREVERITGRPVEVNGGRTAPDQVPVRVGKNGLIRTELGWEPLHSSLSELVLTQWDFLRSKSAEAEGGMRGQLEDTSAHLFGQVAMKLGFATAQQIERALKIQRQDMEAGKPHRLLGLVMLEEGIISNEQLIEILRYYEDGSCLSA